MNTRSSEIQCPRCETYLFIKQDEEKGTNTFLTCPICGYTKETNEDYKFASAGYGNTCKNCHTPLDINSEYCKCCGTKRSDREFNPESNFVPCIYGSPRMLINRKKSNRSIIWMIILILSVIGCICLLVGTLINLL